MWNPRKKVWKPVLNRMYLVSPKDLERYYLRLHLLHVCGATCFEDIRTVDNKILTTFYEAAIACKLIKTDDEWDHCLQEAVNFQFPKALYQLFSFILILHNSSNARKLYDIYKLYFIYPKIHEIISERNALKFINNTLSLHGFSIQDFGLPDIFNELMEYDDDIEDDTCTYTLILMKINL